MEAVGEIDGGDGFGFCSWRDMGLSALMMPMAFPKKTANHESSPRPRSSLRLLRHHRCRRRRRAAEAGAYLGFHAPSCFAWTGGSLGLVSFIPAAPFWRVGGAPFTVGIICPFACQCLPYLSQPKQVLLARFASLCVRACFSSMNGRRNCIPVHEVS